MADELERASNEAAVAYFKVPIRHSLGGTEKKYESQDVFAMTEIRVRHLPNTKRCYSPN
jgi:hypothetical protein